MNDGDVLVKGDSLSSESEVMALSSFIYKALGPRVKLRICTNEEMYIHQKNIQTYETCRMPVCAQFPLINPKSTWKRTQVDQLRIPPSPHPHSTMNGQCKALHGY